jgi:phage tail P2-like protein
VNNWTLLPPNATALEKALDLLSAQMETVAIDIRKIWNPETCPVDLLPWLAWGNSVDFWSADWTEEEKRKTIANAFAVHKTKGTRGALERALAPLGFTVQIIEWFEESPAATPYTFRMQVIVRDKGIDEKLYIQLLQLIETYKNVRSQLSQLLIKGEVSGTAYIGAAITSGIDITIYPYVGSDAQSDSTWFVAAAIQAVNTVTILSLQLSELDMKNLHRLLHETMPSNNYW